MVNYETTLVDLEAGVGGVYQTTVAPVPVKPSRSWIWKTVAVVAFLGLCAVASVFFTWHMMKPEEEKRPEAQTFNIPEHGKMLKQIAQGTKAAIHLHGENKGNILQWVSGVDQSFAQGGLLLNQNEIHIPADGLYFVYSQVSFATVCTPDDNEDQKYLSHSIWRYTDAVGKDMPLQKSAQSACQINDKKTAYSTIYLGAVFKLLEGDKLSTNTTRVADVEEDYSKTFFGVFAL